MFCNVSDLTIDLSLITDIDVIRDLRRINKLSIYGVGEHKTGKIFRALKGILKQVKDFTSRAIPFSRDQQVLLSFRLSKVVYLEFCDAKPLWADDFRCMLVKLKCLKGIYTEVDHRDIAEWAKVLNENCGRLTFHINMVTLVPTRLLSRQRELYSSVV